MKNRWRLQILIDNSKSEIEEEARGLLRNLKKEQERRPDYSLARGIAGHLALFPIRCSECQQTFWASDPYDDHPRCPGLPKKTGFQ